MTVCGNQRGVSLIAAIFIIVILAFMGVVFITLIGTGSFTAVNDLQSAQALYVAEGGAEFHQRNLAQSLDWYLSASDPLAVDTLNLGAGSFTVTTTLPATKLRAQVGIASGNPLRVYSIARFPTPSGCLRVDDEYITYANVGTTVAACLGQPPCFTGVTRGAGACFGGGAQTAHTRGDSVYPVSALSAPLASSCAAPASFSIAANLKFLDVGVIDIEGEEIRYTGSSTSGGTMTLTGVQRCLGLIGPVAHAAGVPVTPLLVGGDTADYQAEIESTGTVGSAVRMMRKTVQR